MAGGVGRRYDRIGRTYTATRGTDPRIAARIWSAMAVLALHHRSDWRAGCAELRRVACERVVVFAWDSTYRLLVGAR